LKEIPMNPLSDRWYWKEHEPKPKEPTPYLSMDAIHETLKMIDPRVWQPAKCRYEVTFDNGETWILSRSLFERYREYMPKGTRIVHVRTIRAEGELSR